MCGIWVYLHKLSKPPSLSYGDIYNAFMSLSPRGPERSNFYKISKYGLYIGFHRLGIIEPIVKADQPIIYESEDKFIYSICNGEIYNFKELQKRYDISVETQSDCDIFIQIYQLIGFNALVKELIGEFALCICDIDKKTRRVKLFVSRDPAGIRPLYITGNEDEIVLTSELKGSPFLKRGYKVMQFPPRYCIEFSNECSNLFDVPFKKAFNYIDFKKIEIGLNDEEIVKVQIRETLSDAVRCRLFTDRPLACLLSGGLDSSIVASISSKYFKDNNAVLNTYSIGMPDSTDEYYAKLVANYIGSNHTHLTIKESEWLEIIPKVVFVTETYDVTTIRATVGQYLISKWISENTDIKVLLIGDGSDELCAGYMYFHEAPDPRSLHLENVRLVEDIHHYDVQRADRGISNNGLEARVPFLDHRFIKLYLSIDPLLRMPSAKGMEKWILRESFANGYLPNEVLTRHKEAFSDAVSPLNKSWHSIIQNYVDRKISDEYFVTNKHKYTHCVPLTKEALFYRELFEFYYGNSEETAKTVPYYWLPKWVDEDSEPSARVLKVYKATKL
ncbi:asparagine synthase (glutamine-hydrolysing) [Babesia microti strain RI]|uniref:asparagine synthase (glutamine-hydrolyzing) n=1 Tax=Babesia microti (strain RI) TaxID=1133968 RepID=A0A0K3ALH0_BABMR|nr:asparagine synthase (glutamine-hydrolysing) [Babesia microti strain RI]XP_021337226.1 asparagine synthase (glutamine-hydrolysing) [Babesia microti strain RI]CTQ40598.1 asparagine synthase (glutamine-hydrolysing) [Babesia microti strain RI]CTQ41568.1 asparagine synthase (glutamine-hydrolysing) [Babesia microti strain RI]|eukprot:XP_012649579.1 asparagine synthase (glutamine-hydrolysing) [Babesia microti strain RI]